MHNFQSWAGSLLIIDIYKFLFGFYLRVGVNKRIDK